MCAYSWINIAQNEISLKTGINPVAPLRLGAGVGRDVAANRNDHLPDLRRLVRRRSQPVSPEREPR